MRLPGTQTPLPIRAYVVGFIALGLVLLLALSVASIHAFEDLQRRMADNEATLAQQELEAAIQHLFNRMEHSAAMLADHEEVRQQLADPTYYDFWRTHRANTIANTPEWVTDIQLFNFSGRPLMQHGNNQVSSTRTAADTQFVLFRNGQMIGSVTAAAQQEKGTTTDPFGYVRISFDLTEALRNLDFKYADISRLTLGAMERAGSPWSVDRVLQELTVPPLPNADNQAMSSLFFGSLVRFGVIAATLGVILYIGMARLMVRPVRHLAGVVDALRSGGEISPVQQQTLAVSELDKMRRSLLGYHEDLTDANRRLDNTNRELWTLAHKDPLTGFGNRRAFDQKLAQLATEKPKSRIHLVLFDCNHFKAINDTYGHHVGDEVLRAIAKRIQSLLRTEDCLYRTGGDEFACIFTGLDTDAVEEVAARCLHTVKAGNIPGLDAIERVGLSAGIGYVDPSETFDPTLLQRRADVAMYRAKRPGSGFVVRWGTAMAGEAEVLASRRVINAVYRGIEDGHGVEMHYQLVQPLQDETCQCFEALARLRDEQGLVPPEQYFPVLESRGLEVEFDAAVINAVAEDLQSGRLDASNGISVNLSAHTLVRNDIEQLLVPLARFIHRRRLVLEVTETGLVSRLDIARENLRRLRETGFEIALDDFGSGYSSFKYLASMPVDIVKFDISLVHALQFDDHMAPFVADLVEMMHRAGYKLTAEGIETPEMLQQVRGLGFQFAQGFLIGHPYRPQSQTAESPRSA